MNPVPLPAGEGCAQGEGRGRLLAQPALIPRARTKALRAFMRGAPFSQREKDDVTAAPMSAIAPGR